MCYWKEPLLPLAISPRQKAHVVGSLIPPGFSVILRKTEMKIQAVREQRRNDLFYSGSKISDKTRCTVSRCGWSVKGSKLRLHFKEPPQRAEFDSILLENSFNNSLSTTFVNSHLQTSGLMTACKSQRGIPEMIQAFICCRGFFLTRMISLETRDRFLERKIKFLRRMLPSL